MIKISNLSLSYSSRTVLEDININISEPGLYLFYGESGSGKSTLLNILSLLENNYSGSYFLFDQDVSLLTPEEKKLIRFNKITYLFQIPKLIENESIKTNLEICLGKELTKAEEKEYLNKIHLKNINKKISSLSGGEKQRVNILMGIIRNTPLILGDEITSGLDNQNKKIILNLLKEEAKNKIIILVSHDVELISKYAKDVRKIENKTLVPLTKKRKTININVSKKNNNKLPFKYSFIHALRTIYSKKIRSLISIFSSSIALTFLGLCLILTTSLKDLVMNSLGSIIKDNQIIMEKEEHDFNIEENISLSKKELNDISSRYKGSSSYLGVHYLTDINSFFEDENYFAYYINSSLINIPSLSLENISSFNVINKEEKDLFYLIKDDDFQEDEIVVSFTHGEISRLCSSLDIEYINDLSLLDYLKSHQLLLIKMFLTNESWDYHFDFTFKVVGYIIDDTKKIYHTDPLWNEYIFESLLQLQSNLNLNVIDEVPWTIKKEYYLYVNKENINIFLSSLLEDSTLNDYKIRSFILDENFGISFYYGHDSYFHINELNTIISSYPYLDSYFPCSDEGYTLLSSVLLAGFSKPLYLSNDYEELEEFINMNSYSEEDLGIYQTTILNYTSENIKSLSILDATKDSFCSIKNYSSKELEFNHIVISSSLADSLNIDRNLSSNKIYFMMLKDTIFSNEKYLNDFKIVTVTIDEIIEDDDICIYSNYLWPITFLMTNFEINNIGINKMIINYSGDNLKEDLKFLNDSYPQYEFSNPYLEYASSIDEIGKYLTLGLGVFSSFCLISTLLLLIVSSSLFVLDTSKEIGIYSLYGYEEKSVKRLYKIYSYIMSFYSFFISFFALFVIYFMINKGSYSISFSSPKVLVVPLLIMFVVSFVIGYISSSISTKSIFKQNSLSLIR